MSITLNKTYTPAYSEKQSSSFSLKRFMKWADKQEKNRMLWTALAVAGHGCVFTIITVVTILITGNNFIFWPFAIGAMATCLIVNLAALPTKITIPVLFISLLIDIIIIITALSQGIDMAASYV